LAKPSAAKKKQKQKARQKKARTARSLTAARDKGEILADQAAEYIDTGHVDKAVAAIKKAVKRLPADEYLLNLMGHIGSVADNTDMELEAMAGLERLGNLFQLPIISNLDYTLYHCRTLNSSSLILRRFAGLGMVRGERCDDVRSFSPIAESVQVVATRSSL